MKGKKERRYFAASNAINLLYSALSSVLYMPIYTHTHTQFLLYLFQTSFPEVSYS